MIFQQLSRVCLARARLIILVALSVFTTALLVSILTPARFSAETTMVVDFPSNDPVLGSTIYMPGTIGNFLATQVDILRSERVISRAIRNLNWENHPKIRLAWLKKTGGKGSLRGWIGASVVKDLRVEASREGASITLSYESFDPQLAAEMTNALAASFIATSIELKNEVSKGYAGQFDAQAQHYRQALREAQAKLSAFQEDAGITAQDERLDVENLQLQELSNQLVQLQGQATEARSRSDAIRRNSRESLPEVIASPLINGLKSDVSRIEQRLQQEASRLGEHHPQLVATQSELNALRQRLSTEVSRVADSLATNRSINEQREAQIRSALEAQRTKVLALKKQRDQLAVLQRDVDTQQRALDLLNQRLTQTTVETQARQSNVSIVSAAFAPDKPARPQPMLNAAIGAFFGVVLGIVAAIAMESLQKPLRSAEDLMHSVPIPVLAVLPHAKSQRPQRLIGHAAIATPTDLRLSHH